VNEAIETPAPGRSPALRRLCGIGAGALAFLMVAQGAGALIPGPGVDTMPGCFVSGGAAALESALVLICAALAAGLCSSIGAGDYVTGTGIFGVSAGACAAALSGPGLGARAEIREEPAAFALTLALELLFGLSLVLSGYFAAWQADLRIVLPRRPGPPYVKKVVGAREILAVNIPAMLLSGGLALTLLLVIAPVLEGSALLMLAWAGVSAVSAGLALVLFPLRSTFFVWIGPGLGMLAGLLLAPALGVSLDRFLAMGPERMTPALVAPAGAFAATLAYLTRRFFAGP